MTRAERNIIWIQKHCRIPEGRDVGKKVELRPWQKKWVKEIYDNPHGTRTAIITIGKKNGKTSFVAFILLLHLCGPEHRKNSQIHSTALSRDQAAVIFELAAKIIRLSPTLKKHVIPGDSAKSLRCEKLGTFYRALSADASTAHGKSTVLAIHDELGQVKGPNSSLYNAIENAMGAHEEPMSIVISTQAPTDNDLLSILIDDAKTGKDPHVVLIMHSADDDVDPFSVKALKQANPAYNDFLNAKELRGQAAKAKRMPSYENEYRNFTLNQRVETAAPAVTKAVWMQNDSEPRGERILYGGLDLSEVNDLTALVLVSNDWSVYPTFWLPEYELGERSRKDRVPYDVWHKKGFLETTPGKSVDYSYIAQHLVKLFKEKNVKRIAFDRYNMRFLRPWLIKAGLAESFVDSRFVDFGQGFVSMSPAWRTTESLLLNGRLKHGAHPVLTMCAQNATIKSDEAGNRKLDKRRSRGRIDGLVALTMACAIASEEQHEARVYPVNKESILENLNA
ncbi:terminase [candidate division KSB1 bacterium]|nr:terminase [candidate division KSB1 bacterium]NIV68726.1 terminase [Phycisphaerae bacterium]NIS25446.1 terminase [candidate division KSB1 bacterium]NIT72338.1 terminase [candidate division KSB1 bacterium]NIU26123.1 terminase [candidate division KSB1 bacterium]